jgi:hypothetical protein
MFNFIKKYCNIFLIIIFLIVVSLHNYKTFLNNYEYNQISSKQLLEVNKSLDTFNLNKIKKLGKIDFYYTPYK